MEKAANLGLYDKLGVDVSANQEEISDHETFQLEFENASKKWYIRTMQDKYFTLQATGGVQANEMKRWDEWKSIESSIKTVQIDFSFNSFAFIIKS